MDIVRFDIALSRHHPRRSPTPLPSSAPASSATVPTINEGLVSPAPSTQSSEGGDLKVPRSSSGIESPLHYDPNSASISLPADMKLSPSSGSVSQTSSNWGNRFHDWMEMDLEHGL